MPFVTESRPCITIECDTCGAVYDNGDGFQPHYPDIESAKADLEWQSDSGWIVIDDRVWCDPCGVAECVCGHVFSAHEDGGACDPREWYGDDDVCWCRHYVPFNELVLLCQEQRWHCYVCGDSDLPSDEVGYDYARNVQRCFVCRAAGERKEVPA